MKLVLFFCGNWMIECLCSKGSYWTMEWSVVSCLVRSFPIFVNVNNIPSLLSTRFHQILIGPTLLKSLLYSSDRSLCDSICFRSVSGCRDSKPSTHCQDEPTPGLFFGDKHNCNLLIVSLSFVSAWVVQILYDHRVPILQSRLVLLLENLMIRRKCVMTYSAFAFIAIVCFFFENEWINLCFPPGLLEGSRWKRSWRDCFWMTLFITARWFCILSPPFLP